MLSSKHYEDVQGSIIVVKEGKLSYKENIYGVALHKGLREHYSVGQGAKKEMKMSRKIKDRKKKQVKTSL